MRILLTLACSIGLMGATTQDGPEFERQAETEIVVALPRGDTPALQRLRDRLGARVVTETSTQAQVWSLPADRIDEAFAAFQSVRDVSAADYAGEDFRTLMIGVDPAAVTTQERAQLDALAAWPGVAEVEVQRTRRGALSSGLLADAYGAAEGFQQGKSFLLSLPGRSVSAVGTLGPEGRAGDLVAASVAMPGREGDARFVGEALLRRSGDALSGTVVLEDDAYLITPIGERGLQAVVRLDPRTLPPDHPGDGPGGAEAAQQQTRSTHYSRYERGRPVVRIGVLFTPAADRRLDSIGRDLTDAVESMVLLADDGLERSGATFSLALSAVHSVSGSETTIPEDLRALQARGDGRWDEVHAWRDATRSDLVILMVDSTGSSCGQAGAIPAAPDQAFAVIDVRCGLQNHTLAHEVGHLLGGMHVKDAVTTTTPDFARGFVGGSWRTIMAERDACDGCGRVNHWANPSVTFRGAPSGVPDRNHDIRALNANAVIAAGFR